MVLSLDAVPKIAAKTKRNLMMLLFGANLKIAYQIFISLNETDLTFQFVTKLDIDKISLGMTINLLIFIIRSIIHQLKNENTLIFIKNNVKYSLTQTILPDIEMGISFPRQSIINEPLLSEDTIVIFRAGDDESFTQQYLYQLTYPNVTSIFLLYSILAFSTHNLIIDVIQWVIFIPVFIKLLSQIEVNILKILLTKFELSYLVINIIVITFLETYRLVVIQSISEIPKNIAFAIISILIIASDSMPTQTDNTKKLHIILLQFVYIILYFTNNNEIDITICQIYCVNILQFKLSYITSLLIHLFKLTVNLFLREHTFLFIRNNITCEFYDGNNNEPQLERHISARRPTVIR
jgi:hypothetical protein